MSSSNIRSDSLGIICGSSEVLVKIKPPAESTESNKSNVDSDLAPNARIMDLRAPSPSGRRLSRNLIAAWRLGFRSIGRLRLMGTVTPSS